MPSYTPYTGNVNPSHAGPLDADIFYLAEAPWKTETRLGEPLKGGSGLKWNEWLWKAGLHRPAIRIENLYPYQPPKRDISSVPDRDLIPWMYNLHERIANLPGEGPKVIVTAGNYATYALTGKGQVRASIRNEFSALQESATEAEKKAGITSLRGSIYQYEDRNGRRMKVIPTIHPAAVLQHEKWNKRCLCDWQRVAEEALTRDYNPPKREHIIDPTEEYVANYVKIVEANAANLKLAVDIETWGKTLSCVGFAFTPEQSLTIPTLKKDEREVFLPYVKRLCECDAEKVLCNGLYDWYWLDAYGIQLWRFLWDVQLMHHAFDPVESHSLEFLASIYTKQQYWKDEAKDAEEIIKYAKKAESLWVYNGLDCCVTHELLPILWRELGERGLDRFYFQHYQALIEPLLRMMRHGTRVHVKKQKQWRKVLLGEMKEIRQELEDAAGENLFATEWKTRMREPTQAEMDLLLPEGEVEIDPKTNAPKGKLIDREARAKLIEQGVTYMIGGKNAGLCREKYEVDKKTFSDAKLMRFFHETLGLPKRYKRRKGKDKPTLSLDEGVIRGYTAKMPGKIGNYGNLLLAYREKEKEAQYLNHAWDSDERVRCSYKMITEAGRLSSSKNPMRSGLNLQNIKR
jgi:uracil-DNA glycosylase family 4